MKNENSSSFNGCHLIKAAVDSRMCGSVEAPDQKFDSFLVAKFLRIPNPIKAKLIAPCKQWGSVSPKRELSQSDWQESVEKWSAVRFCS